MAKWYVRLFSPPLAFADMCCSVSGIACSDTEPSEFWEELAAIWRPLVGFHGRCAAGSLSLHSTSFRAWLAHVTQGFARRSW
jgi:hypothetical protein